MSLADLPLPDGALAYAPGWVRDADRVFAKLHGGLAWETHVITLFGRKIPSPRLSAWYGDPGARYTYSGLTLEPRPWTPTLGGLRDRLGHDLGAAPNSVLANLYRNGQDSMGWHSDDEPELGPEPTIASISLGAPRRFVLRHKHKAAPAVELVLEHGSLLVMSGTTQTFWKHAVPKTTAPVGPRINLTFRTIRR